MLEHENVIRPIELYKRRLTYDHDMLAALERRREIVMDELHRLDEQITTVRTDVMETWNLINKI